MRDGCAYRSATHLGVAMARFTAGTTRQPAFDSSNGHPTLSAARHAILEAVGQLTAEHGWPPTRRELLSHTGITSHRQSTEAVRALEQAGRLRRLPGARGLIVLPLLPVGE